MADALATMASMFKIGANTEIQPIYVQIKNLPAHVMSVEDEVDENPWYFDILQYIKQQVYPEHATEVDKRTLRRMVAGYFLSGETLYKKGRDGTLMRCVDSAEARKILEEVHGGSYGSHASGHRMARQIMRAGYYWLTLETDCIGHVRKCHKCQEHGDYIHVPPNPLHVITSPWPFSMWGIDFIGMITPKASNGH
ncbi:hypothetical protein CCACVL1_03466 [Corchorus capsularis]|uniref:Integrase zinc-binding domain-containing protein n=1 Tax=Corchorus capsularis TaxID=210143 RepID=A0A1R3JZ66_COCAP|nr:hypothetical protein CCACVL1_03466 [Corchorus capsularis]